MSSHQSNLVDRNGTKGQPARIRQFRFIRLLPAAGLLSLILLLASSAAGEGLTLQATPESQELEASTLDPRFGVIESYESPPDADDLKVGWTRIIFQWARVQDEGPDSWTPKVSDEQIAADLDAGREVVGLLIGIPDWARDEDRLPQGLWLAHDDPGNLWANYVREVVSRYQGRISHWIIWNEPDISETEIAHTWDGSVADFAQLLRVAYLATKEENPESVIHLSAFTYWADVFGETEQYMARLLDEIMTDPQAADHNYYFDIATAHLYFQPAQVYDLLTFFTDILQERGLDHPIWLVETNAPPRDDPDWPVPDWFLSVTLGEQAAFIPQALSSAIAAGAERIAVYKLRDNEEDRFANPEPFGLLRLDGFPRPAYDTYRLAIEQLSGSTNAERERWDSVGQIRVDQPGKSTTVLFSRLPSDQLAQIEATADTALLVDMWGETQTVLPDDGYYEVSLPAASCSQTIGDYCMIGGLTYYLVQIEPVPPTPTSTAAPSSTPTTVAIDTVRATVTIAVTSTDAPTTAPSLTAAPSVTSPARSPEPTSPTPVPDLDLEDTRVGEPTPIPSEQALESPGTLGLWFLGGGILLAALIAAYWIAQRRR
jgi:hypothetical protein